MNHASGEYASTLRGARLLAAIVAAIAVTVTGGANAAPPKQKSTPSTIKYLPIPNTIVGQRSVLSIGALR